MTSNAAPKFEIEFLRANETRRGIKATVVLKKDGETVLDSLRNLEDAADQEELIEELEGKGVKGARRKLLQKLGELRTALSESKRKPIELKYADDKYVHLIRGHISELESHGDFLVTPDQRTWYSNGVWPEPVQITESRGSPLRLVLAQSYNMNRHDPYFKRLVEAMDVHAFLHGQKAEIYKLSWYDSEANLMSLYLGEGKVLKVTADPKEAPMIVKNGDTGALLESSAGFEPWEYVPPDRNPRTLIEDLIDPVSFDESSDTPLTIEDMRLLARIWLVSTFFRAIMPTRPIACGIGPTGAGKTEMFRQFGKVLIGPAFEPDAPVRDNDEGFRAAVVNRPYYVLDNADQRIPWLEDDLARVATGGQFSDRAKYTNFDEITVRPDAMVAITSREPRFRRIDVAGRLLLFPMRTRRDSGLSNLAPDQLNRRTAYNRNAYMSELVDWIKLVLQTPPQEPADVPPHIGDFYRLALRIAYALGQEDQLLGAFDRLRGTQTRFATEEDVLVQALALWVEETSYGAPNDGRWITATVLFNELKAAAETAGMRWWIQGPSQLGRKLRELAAAGATESQFHIEPRRHGPSEWQISKLETWEKLQLL